MRGGAAKDTAVEVEVKKVVEQLQALSKQLAEQKVMTTDPKFKELVVSFEKQRDALRASPAFAESVKKASRQVKYDMQKDADYQKQVNNSAEQIVIMADPAFKELAKAAEDCTKEIKTTRDFKQKVKAEADKIAAEQEGRQADPKFKELAEYVAERRVLGQSPKLMEHVKKIEGFVSKMKGDKKFQQKVTETSKHIMAEHLKA